VNIRHRGELTDHTAETVVLGIEQSGPAVTFYTMAANGTKIRLARDLDASLLSTQVAGGFVGTTLGMHARSGDYASKSEQ
jgi:alpha-N-arabinofuranosidase